MTSSTDAPASGGKGLSAEQAAAGRRKPKSQTRVFFGRYRLIMLSAYLGLVAVSLVVFWAVLSARQEAEVELVQERLKEHVLVVDVLAKIGGDTAAAVARSLAVQLQKKHPPASHTGGGSQGPAKTSLTALWPSTLQEQGLRVAQHPGLPSRDRRFPERITGPDWPDLWAGEQSLLERLQLDALALERVAPGLANLAFISKEGLVASWKGNFATQASSLQNQIKDVLARAGTRRNPTGSVVVLTSQSASETQGHSQFIRFLAPVTGKDGFLGVVLAGFSPVDLNRVHRNFYVEGGLTFALSPEDHVLGLPGEAQSVSGRGMFGLDYQQAVTLENAAFLTTRQREVISARRELPTGEMITRLDDDFVYFFQGLTFAPWSVVFVGSLDAIRGPLLEETALLVGALLGALTLLLLIANKLTRREFIDPTYALVEHLRRGGRPVSQSDKDAPKKRNEIPDGWRPFFQTVTQVFEENSKAVSLRQELETAADMQASILPDPLPDQPNLQLFAFNRPAKEMGGDFYDYFPIDENRLGFVMADVSGKGMPAAIFMVLSRTLMKATASNGSSPAECLARVNNLLEQENKALMFVTLFYGILDIPSGQVVYANGGHNPPYILRRDGSISALPQTDGMALGVFEGADFEEASLQLAPGDQLFLYTDGITEAFSAAKEEFGEPRLEAFLSSLLAGDDHLATRSVEDITLAVVQDVDDFAVGTDQFDDITCLTLRRPLTL